MSDTKSKLSGARWRLYKESTLEVDGELVPVVYRKPPDQVVLATLKRARAAGEVDEQNNAKDEVAAVRLVARIVALTLFERDGVRPMYSEEEVPGLFDAPWLMSAQADAFAAIGLNVETLKGNSDATPSSP